MFVSTSIVKKSNKEKYVYSGYKIALDGNGAWSFERGSPRNVITFSVDNSSLAHSGNRKKKFLTLGESPTYGTNGSFGPPEKKFSINCTKANTQFCLRLHHNADNSHLLVNGKEIFEFKADNENVNFPTEFCIRSISNGFSPTESREETLNGNVYNFQSITILLINLTY